MLGQLTGSVASIATTVAALFVGSISTYLANNKDFIIFIICYSYGFERFINTVSYSSCNCFYWFKHTFNSISTYLENNKDFIKGTILQWFNISTRANTVSKIFPINSANLPKNVIIPSTAGCICSSHIAEKLSAIPSERNI